MLTVMLMIRSAGMGPHAGPRVCILGGGFGGLYTATRLDQLLWPQNMKPQVRMSRFDCQ